MGTLSQRYNEEFLNRAEERKEKELPRQATFW